MERAPNTSQHTSINSQTQTAAVQICPLTKPFDDLIMITLFLMLALFKTKKKRKMDSLCCTLSSVQRNIQIQRDGQLPCIPLQEASLQAVTVPILLVLHTKHFKHKDESVNIVLVPLAPSPTPS